MANKEITDLTLRSNFDDTCNIVVRDATQAYRATGLQVAQHCKLETVQPAGGTSGVTLTTASPDVNVFAPTSEITIKLDNSFLAGRSITIMNAGTADILVTANNDASLTEILPLGAGRFTATATPATPANWSFLRSETGKQRSLAVTGENLTNLSGYDIFYMNTSAGNRTVSLPAVASNYGRSITIMKTNSDVATVTINPFSGDSLDGFTSIVLDTQREVLTIHGDRAAGRWRVLSHEVPKRTYVANTAYANGSTTTFAGTPSPTLIRSAFVPWKDFNRTSGDFFWYCDFHLQYSITASTNSFVTINDLNMRFGACSLLRNNGAATAPTSTRSSEGGAWVIGNKFESGTDSGNRTFHTFTGRALLVSKPTWAY